jgi:hypothetical protein
MVFGDQFLAGDAVLNPWNRVEALDADLPVPQLKHSPNVPRRIRSSAASIALSKAWSRDFCPRSISLDSDAFARSPSSFPVGSLQCSLYPHKLQFASRDLPRWLAMAACGVQATLMTGEHPSKDRQALFFGCAWVQPRQTKPPGQCSPVGNAHRCVPMSRRLQLAAKAAYSRVLQTVFTAVCVVEIANGLAILLGSCWDRAWHRTSRSPETHGRAGLESHAPVRCCSDVPRHRQLPDSNGCPPPSLGYLDKGGDSSRSASVVRAPPMQAHAAMVSLHKSGIDARYPFHMIRITFFRNRKRVTTDVSRQRARQFASLDRILET